MRSEKIKWTVQGRISRKHKWRPMGTYETRAAARADCANLRDIEGFGFGCTRVVRKITGGL
jgi:hypothetical protein